MMITDNTPQCRVSPALRSSSLYNIYKQRRCSAEKFVIRECALLLQYCAICVTIDEY